MGNPKIVGALLVLALSLGCANFTRSFRKPGEKIHAFPEEVWSEYDCQSQKRPFFIIEQNELVPSTVAAGGAFNHRMIYAMCPRQPTEVVTGTLHTRIRYRGNPILREATDSYEIKPGRWVVDAEVSLPPDAEPGVYAYEIGFQGSGVRFEKRLTFIVRGR